MPAALTLILICPPAGSGRGTGAHCSTSGGPYPVITTALGMALPSWQRPGKGRERQRQRARCLLFLLHRSRRTQACRQPGELPSPDSSDLEAIVAPCSRKTISLGL